MTRDGAVWYSPRSSPDAAAFGVLYPIPVAITDQHAMADQYARSIPLLSRPVSGSTVRSVV
jgi:hypothetical protein